MERKRLEVIANKVLEDKELVDAFKEEAKKEHEQEQKKATDGRRRLQFRRNPVWMEPHHFPPGVSGNPKGRPVVKKVSQAVTNFLHEIEPTSGFTNAELIARAMGQKAKNGDVAAARFLYEASEGPFSQKLEVSGSMSIDHNVAGKSEEELLEIIVSYQTRDEAAIKAFIESGHGKHEQ